MNDRYEMRTRWLEEIEKAFSLEATQHAVQKSSVFMTGRYFRVVRAEARLRELLDIAHARFQHRQPVAEEEWRPSSSEIED